MERDPHQLIEGCLIACYAAGAVAVLPLHPRRDGRSPRSGSPPRSTRPTPPATSARTSSAPSFSVDIVLHWGAGAYVVGEETALIESLEGNRGMPRLKPPYFPAAIGLYGKPTIVNNVETLSNLPWLMRQRRRGVHRHRHRDLAGHAHGRGVRPRQAARRVRDRQRHHHVPRPDLRRRVLPAASATATSSRRSCPAAARRRGSCPTSSTCRSRASSSARPARCSAPAR